MPSYFGANGRVSEPSADSGNKLGNGRYEAGLHATLYNFQEFADLFIAWVNELKEIGNHKLMMFDFDRPIESLVQDAKLSKMTKGRFGGSVEKILVDTLDFSEAIQKRYAEQYQDAAPVKGELHFQKSTAGYALLDCLLIGVETILKKSEVALILKFQ